MLKKFICLMLLLICISCSSGKSSLKKNEDTNVLIEPESLYKLAKMSFDQENFNLAKNQFLEIRKLFPLSDEAIQSEIMIAFIDYVQMNYDNAIFAGNNGLDNYQMDS